MTRDEISIAIARIDGALANKGAIRWIIAEGHGQSNRDVPVKLTPGESEVVFKALRNVLRQSAGV